MNLLCLKLKEYISGQPGTFATEVNTAALASEIQLARQNKISPIFDRALAMGGLDTTAVAEFQEDKRYVAASNLRVLQIVHNVNVLFQKHHIVHVFYKGPLQQKIIYGDFFAKPCSDADILVPYSSFNAARDILESADFKMATECNSIWWRYFLGEQALFPGGHRPHSIDLHHRLQQPGCPPPRQIMDFIEHSQSVSLGSGSIEIPTTPHIALIAAMNLVKGIYNRQPSGNHCIDLLVVLRKLSPADIVSLKNTAKLQGLNQTLQVASYICALAIGIEDILGGRVKTIKLTTEEARQLIFAPDSNSNHLPRRSKMLMALCDNPIIDYPVEATRWKVSDCVRMLTYPSN
jgi:hypothetical protein